VSQNICATNGELFCCKNVQKKGDDGIIRLTFRAREKNSSVIEITVENVPASIGTFFILYISIN
jgi:hypothetical protein